MTSTPAVESTMKPRLAFAYSLVKKSPATVLLMLVVIVATASIGALTGQPSDDVLAPIGLDISDVLTTWWTLVVSAFFAPSWWSLILLLAAIAACVGVAEQIIGPWKAVGLFVLGHVVSCLFVAGLSALGTAENDAWLAFIGGNYLVGGFGGAAASLGAATAAMKNLWRHRTRTWLMAISAMFVLYLGIAETLQLLAGALFGILVGRLFGLGHPGTKGHLFVRPSLRESRFLLATVVGTLALGPLLSQLTANFAVGPLSIVGMLSLQNSPGPEELADMCDGDAACTNLQQIVGVSSFGAVVLALIPTMLLLMCSEGLRRGRRLAMWTALIINAFMAVMIMTALVLLLVDPDFSATGSDLGFIMFYIMPAALVPAIIAILLYAHRGKFTVTGNAQSTRGLLWTTGLVAAGVVLFFIIMWFVEGNLGRLDLGDLLSQLPRILIPFPLPVVTNLPQGLVTVLLFGFGGAIIWLVFGILAFRRLRQYRAETEKSAEGEAQIRELLQAGGGSLSWMALWKNNAYWVSADGRNAVAYQVNNGVALTVAGPFGAVDGQAQAARDFVAFAIAEGLIPCFYSADGEVGAALKGLHFARLEVAEETLLNVDAMTFKGKEWQNVRTALNRADKLGIKDVWASHSALPPGIRAQFAEISEEWVSDKSLPEMGFTLGGLDELKDAQVMCCAAVDDDGLVHGVTSWLPVYTDQQITGWTLDFMRRRSDGFKGVMEFLIASAVTHFKEDVPMISLSGSPLANTVDGGADGESSTIEKVLGMLGNALEPMYGFKSLAAFKSRFQPEHRTLFMYYQDSLALPAIGLAISSAYLPGLSARQGAEFLRQMASAGDGAK